MIKNWLSDRCAIFIDKQKKEFAYRTALPRPSGIDFYTNDYLGLARNKDYQQALQQKIAALSSISGSTGSRLLGGSNELTHSLENQLSAFFKGKAALLYSSGYMANIGLLASLSKKEDVILYDEQIHASLKESLRLTYCSFYSFMHNDCGNLESLCKRYSDNTIWIVTEAVFSMDGSLAPLETIATISKKYNAALVVDEAHSTGLYGENGEGLVVSLGLESEVDIRIHTFGKALASQGACVVANSSIINTLINTSRSFIYSTAPPPMVLVSIAEGLRYLQQHPSSMERLRNITTYFDMLFSWEGEFSPIRYIPLSGNKAVLAMSKKLEKHGIIAPAIRSPTVKKGEERIRICLHAYNTREEIDLLHQLTHE